MQSSWMWQDEASGGVKGAIADYDRQIIQWFDEPGCACMDSESDQAFSEFLEQGARAIVPPDDIYQEMRQALVEFGGQGSVTP